MCQMWLQSFICYKMWKSWQFYVYGWYFNQITGVQVELPIPLIYVPACMIKTIHNKELKSRWLKSLRAMIFITYKQKGLSYKTEHIDYTIGSGCVGVRSSIQISLIWFEIHYLKNSMCIVICINALLVQNCKY